MFEFFKRNRQSKQPAAGVPLFFRDGAAAFAYVCEYMECPLVEGSALPALVMNGSQRFGTPQAVSIGPDGNQIALLRVGSSDGGFLVVASTVGPKGPALQPGQFVLWQAGKHSPAVAQQAKDQRFGWVGLILGTLKTEYRDGSWIGDKRFLPS
jgi:hypothetical protein